MKKILYMLMFRFIPTFAAIAMLSAIPVKAQEQAIYGTITIPAKKDIVYTNIVLGGEAYIHLLDGRVVVKSELGFKDAVGLLLNGDNTGSTDQLVAGGTARFYLQNKEVKNRFFVEGGIINTFNLNAPVEGITINQAKSAVGLNFNNRVIPRFEFNTQDFTGTAFVGREYRFEVPIFIPINKVRIGVEPFIARKTGLVPYTEYGLQLKFGRVF